MIIFLTLLYAAILFALVKLAILPNKPATWLSIIGFNLLMTVFLFIPMQWGAPTGPARVMTRAVQIVPNIAGQVEAVEAVANIPVQQGDTLFRIDPEPYEIAARMAEATLLRVETLAEQDLERLEAAEARLRQAEANLGLAQKRFDDDAQLVASGAIPQSRLDERKTSLETALGAVDEARSVVSKLELSVGAVMEDGTIAKVAEARAGLEQAKWNLEQTNVRAPFDGVPTNVALAAGQVLVNLPLAPAMVFVDTSEPKLFAEIHQTHLRHIEIGQVAEIAFNHFPGEVFPGTVRSVLPMTQAGQGMVAGNLPAAGQIVAEPIFVRIELDDPEILAQMPAGSVGNVAIYTDQMQVAHVIRMVMLRMESILNYVDPRV